MKTSSISKFVLLLSVSILFLSFGIQDMPVPGKNKVAVGNTRVSLVERELVVDYQVRFGQNVASCDVDVIVLVDYIPYRFTKYYSGDFGRQSIPGSKQLRLKVSPQKELLSSRDIKFRIDVVRTELKDGKVVKSPLAIVMPEVQTSMTVKGDSRSAICCGKVVSDGGSEVTVRGIVWGTEPNPTVKLETMTNEGKGVGEFESTLNNLKPGKKYYFRAFAKNSTGTAYGAECSFTTRPEKPSVQTSGLSDMKLVNLSSLGTANCYIVSESGFYKFRTVKGNSSESVSSVSMADVLWETFGTDKAPEVGDLVRGVFLDGDYIVFQVPAPYRKGNAVIAARDESGEILWSWHIWLTDEPTSQEYLHGAGVMMDRNLGAISATLGDVGALGLLYQWGRKDPFLNSSSISSSVEAKSTITWSSSVPSSSSTGTIAYAIAHPTTFIISNEHNKDWYYSSSSSTDDTRWKSSKTIYDPCPPGWRVPDGGESGVWANAFGTSDVSIISKSSNWDWVNKGMDFSKTYKELGPSDPIWYPASGCRGRSSESLCYVGSIGFYWSVSPDGNSAYDLYFGKNGLVRPASDDDRDYGLPVRCLQE